MIVDIFKSYGLQKRITMKQLVATFILIYSLSCCICDRISNLESRVEALEDQFSKLVPSLVVKFGLVARCSLPTVDHGKVTCSSDDRVPGTTCEAHCHPGYVATPRRHQTRCLKTADWSVQLSCEIPLLVVSGGTVDGKQTGDSGVEVLNFHNGTGCDLNIPDMPQTKDGEHRIMHNLIYVPNAGASYHPPHLYLLACNGLTQSPKATCDSWRPGDIGWNFHSNPNEGDALSNAMIDLHIQSSYDPLGLADEAREKKFMSKSGRYAAVSFSTAEQTYIIGGMLHNTTKHMPTKTVRRLVGTHWDGYDKFVRRGPKDLNKDRAFFCIAQLDSNYLAIGGYSAVIEKSSEDIWNKRKSIPDMAVSRSGHSCTGIGDNQILVSGGSRTDGARALAGAELYNKETGRWEVVGEMVRMRFGHALVNVGGRIIALGGKERNPDVVISSGEEFDPATKSWTTLGQVLSKPRANFGYTLIPHSLVPGCKIQENLDPGSVDPK